MIRVADKREIKCKVIQFALYFLNNFVVLVTVLLAFLMELKMNGKKISSYLGKRFLRAGVFISVRRKKEHGIPTWKKQRLCNFTFTFFFIFIYFFILSFYF